MLDEKDLQAIAQLMDLKMAQQKKEIIGELDTKMAQQKKEIISEVKVLIEADIQPKFNLLADGLAAVNEKLKILPDPDLMDKPRTAQAAHPGDQRTEKGPVTGSVGTQKAAPGGAAFSDGLYRTNV